MGRDPRKHVEPLQLSEGTGQSLYPLPLWKKLDWGGKGFVMGARREGMMDHEHDTRKHAELLRLSEDATSAF